MKILVMSVAMKHALKRKWILYLILLSSLCGYMLNPNESLNYAASRRITCRGKRPLHIQHIRKAEVANKSKSVIVLVCTYPEAASVRGLVKLGTPAVTCYG